MARYSIVKRQRKYYKDGVEVPAESITDFGSYKYFKNVVTTKYWKEITTGSKELEYACYTINGYYEYAKAPIGSDALRYGVVGKDTLVTDSSQLGVYPEFPWETLTEEKAVILGITYTRYTAGDLYKDTTVTETVEGTPEDYTYTTEEITPVEVTADDDYDFTEFVPSTQFDYYEDKNKLYTPTKRHRTYYKYGTEPNVTVVGSPTIVDGIVSGFTTNNYLQIAMPDFSKADNWETIFKINLSSTSSEVRQIFASSKSNPAVTTSITASNQVGLATGNGSSWNITESTAHGNTVLELNKDYWVKLEFTGSEYILYLSTDGEVYNTEYTYTSSAKIPYSSSYNFNIGVNRDNAYYPLSGGSIDLTQSYIKINNKDWWRGTKVVESTEADADYYTERNVPYNFVYNPYEVISETFNVSSELQTYIVPEGVDKLNVVCVASRGATGSAAGGAGGSVKCDLSVTPNQTLYITVGGIPSSAGSPFYNASDIRIDGTELANRIIVAGGGGSGAWRRGSGVGGKGGGLVGENGASSGYTGGGGGGTQTSGGAGGTVQSVGSQWSSYGGSGSLGIGGTSDNHSNHYAIGGVGGAGYYGGGGGGGIHTANFNQAAGGGGGSSYTDDTLCTNVIHLQGNNNDEGFVKISYIKGIYK